MTAKTYCKVRGGKVVAREVKDNPTVRLNSRGHPIWRELDDSAPMPAYDPATHHAPVAREVIENDRVVRLWNPPVAKTAAELDDEKEGRLGHVDRALIRTMFQIANDVRALEKKPEITMAQFRQAIKDRM